LKVMKGLRDQEASPEYELDADEPVFVIGVVSELVDIPIWTLRVLDREGIVSPKRRKSGIRLYCLNDIRLLQKVRRLMVVQRVNVRGIRIILRMQV
jgi:DNA-binding transcriptional MerR regulator